MVTLNFKKAPNRDQAINRRNQQIRFYGAVVLRAFDVAREFAMDKS